MTVILFGIYSKGAEYPRQRNLIAGLTAAGANVHECRFAMAGSFQKRFRSATTVTGLLGFLADLLRSYLSLSWQYFRAPKADALLVLYPGYFHVRFLKFLRLFKNRKASIVYDVFFSLYDALILDRKIIGKSSWTARIVYLIDRNACRAADVVLADTHAHASHLSVLLKLPRERFHRIFVGPTFPPFPGTPQPQIAAKFTVLYVGTYIPLHGMETILGAAEKLKNETAFRFTLVGSGQLEGGIRELTREKGLGNITFRDRVPAEKLGELLRSCGLALGIFGTTEKSQSVIPIKVFDICAAGVPFVTADTPAIREVFTHGVNAYLVPPGDPEALAEAIWNLKENLDLRNRIAQGGHRLARTVFSTDKIGIELAGIIEELTHRHGDAGIR